MINIEPIKAFNDNYILLAINRKKGFQGMIMGIILVVSDKLGFAVLITKLIDKLRHYRFLIWRKKLY